MPSSTQFHPSRHQHHQHQCTSMPTCTTDSSPPRAASRLLPVALASLREPALLPLARATTREPVGLHGEIVLDSTSPVSSVSSSGTHQDPFLLHSRAAPRAGIWPAGNSTHAGSGPAAASRSVQVSDISENLHTGSRPAPANPSIPFATIPSLQNSTPQTASKATKNRNKTQK